MKIYAKKLVNILREEIVKKILKKLNKKFRIVKKKEIQVIRMFRNT